MFIKFRNFKPDLNLSLKDFLENNGKKLHSNQQ